MTKTAAMNTIIGPITHAETETAGGIPVIAGNIPHTYWNGRERATTEYNFSFTDIAPNRQAAFQVGVVAKVDFTLVRDAYTFKLKATNLTPLGQAVEGVETVAINRVTGPIGNAAMDDHNGVPYARIGIPREIREGNNIETLWLNFSFWRVPDHLEFLYQKGNVVTVDYHLINKDGQYDLRPAGSINVHAYPKKKATAS